MFIKIKLEPQKLKDLSSLKKISYFSIDDNATIINLKIKIEEYVDVPAERQEIRTLVEVFQNDWCVKEVCNVRESTIMLYAYHEDNEIADPQFVCFLQVYNNELAAQQQELEQRSKLIMNNAKITPTSSNTKVPLVTISDTDVDSGESDNESFSSKSTATADSSCSTDSSESSSRKKRRKYEKESTLKIKKLKVTVTSEGQYSETLCQYLDAFPKCPKQSNTTDYKIPTANEISSKEIIDNDCSTNCKSSNIDKENANVNKHPENTNLQALSKTKIPDANFIKLQPNMVATTISKHNKNIHPCYSISPEIRDFLAIISPCDVKNISNIECQELLVWFFDQFRACDSANDLQFDSKTALTFFEGKIWIACMNMKTFDWISTNIIKYSLKSYMILELKDSKHLCEVVVPVVSDSKNVLDIFDLLEKQNSNIITLKWSVQSRQLLLEKDEDFNEKAISTFCTNELFNIAMDTESKNYLEQLNFKLKYCFWQLIFKFI